MIMLSGKSIGYGKSQMLVNDGIKALSRVAPLQSITLTIYDIRDSNKYRLKPRAKRVWREVRFVVNNYMLFYKVITHFLSRLPFQIPSIKGFMGHEKCTGMPGAQSPPRVRVYRNSTET